MSESRSPFDPPVAGTGLAEPAELVAPFLPSVRVGTTPDAPTNPVASVAEFNARKMVESQRAKVAEPSYGGLPTAFDESNKAAIEAGRERMLAARRKNNRFARTVMMVLSGIVVASGVGMYFLFQASQDEGEVPAETIAPAPTPTSAPSATPVTTGALEGAAATTAPPPGAASPLGQQEQVIELQDQVNSGATPGAGGLMDAVNQAQQAVDGVNASGTTAPSQP